MRLDASKMFQARVLPVSSAVTRATLPLRSTLRLMSLVSSKITNKTSPTCSLLYAKIMGSPYTVAKKAVISSLVLRALLTKRPNS